MIKVVGIGAGGHAKVVIDILRSMGGYEIVGLLDPKPMMLNNTVMGFHILGNDEILPELYTNGLRHAFIGLGSASDTSPRKQLYEKVRRQGFHVVNAIDPRAIISPSAKIGHGPTIMAGAIINADVSVGDNVIINTGAIVEHDCNIRDNVHIATGAHIAGTAYIGAGAHIGIGSVIRQNIRIGEKAVVGAGAVVINDVPDGQTVVGNPARAIERISHG